MLITWRVKHVQLKGTRKLGKRSVHLLTSNTRRHRWGWLLQGRRWIWGTSFAINMLTVSPVLDHRKLNCPLQCTTKPTRWLWTLLAKLKVVMKNRCNKSLLTPMENEWQLKCFKKKASVRGKVSNKHADYGSHPGPFSAHLPLAQLPKIVYFPEGAFGHFHRPEWGEPFSLKK